MATPIETAERNINKQLKQLTESKTDDKIKAQLSDGLQGVKRLLQTVDQITDPENPPGPDTAWGKVIALGRTQKEVSAILSGSPADAGF